MAMISDSLSKLVRAATLLALAFLASLVTFTAQAALPGPTSASFDKGVKFTVAGYTGSTLSGFPVLVRIAENSPNGFSYADLHSPTTGDDIAFVGMDGSGLPFEIDTWNTNGTSLIWVRLPTMEQNTQFVMCWGSDSSGKTVCNESPFAGYVGVWHMSEASGTVVDSSGHSLDAVPSGAGADTLSVAVSGPVGNGRQCTTNTSVRSYLTVPSYDSLNVGNTFAVSGWFNVRSGQPAKDARLFARKTYYTEANGWEVVWKSNKAFSTRGASSTADAQYNTDIGQGWKHFFIVYDNRTSTIFENGVQKAQKTNGTAATDNNSALGIGDYPSNNTGPLVGSVDECRLLDAVPSADWVKAEYDSMTDAAFLTAETAEAYEATDDPQAGVQVSDISYTNATITATVTSRGTGAASADVTVELAASDDFASPLWSTNYTVDADNDAQSFAVIGLEVGTTYYVRAVVENSEHATLTTPAVSFTTMTPGSPVGKAEFVERGFSTLAATATVSSFGAGGESALVRLEASTDGFTNVIASTELDVALDVVADLLVDGLSADTAYSLRVRIRNEWGSDTFVELPTMATRAVPFATTGIGWTFSPDGSTIEITFGISGVYDGAVGTATLAYGGVEQGAKTVTGAETLSWPGIAVVHGNPVARVVLSAELDGQTYTQAFEATIASSSTSVFVSDIMDHVSAETAVRVHQGDVVTLPELSGSEQYIVGNKLFASLDGNVLTALRPGIVGVHCIGNDSTTNTLAVLVLPEKIGNGDIYIFKDASVGDNWCHWNDPAKWEKLGSETNDSWPHNPDDIAIVGFYRNVGVQFDPRDGGCTMGALYAGGYRDTAASLTLRCVTKQGNVLLTSPIRFRRSDGEPVMVQLCSNSTDLGNNQFRTTLTVQDNVPLLEYASDTILSGGWDGTDSRFPQGRFSIGAKTNAIPAGVTVELVEMDTQGQSMGCTLSITRLAGEGTFWNHSSATMRVYGSPLFAGLLRDSGGYRAGTADRTAPTYVRTASLTNTAAEVVGWVGRDGSDPQSDFTKGVGALVSGWPHFYNSSDPHDPWFPAKGTTMHGGLLHNRSENDSDWIVSAETNFVENADGSVKTNVTVLATIPDKRLTDFLDIACGFVYLRTYSDHVNYPTTWFEAGDLRHENRASLYAVDARIYGTGNAANTATILHGASAHAIGVAGDPLESNAYPIIPWIATQVGSKAAEDMGFAAFNDDDWLTKVFHEKNKALSTFGSSDNAYVFDAGIALEADLTCNSLSLHNDRRDKLLGAGRTLTLLSGGLILGDIDWDGTTTSAAIGTEDGGDANGSLILGDADHPAYVWARGKVSGSAKYAPNEIWAQVTAPGGFVAAYTGDLILGGDQSGIAGEIAVNAGSLQLGTASSNCKLARNLPIRIFANATLRLPNAESARSAIVRFDGAAGWFGKVEVPEGIAAKCWKAYWRDYPETQEWQNLRRGVYTGDEATALANPKVVYDPEHFSGAGTLEVLRDDLAMPLLIRLK